MTTRFQQKSVARMSHEPRKLCLYSIENARLPSFRELVLFTTIFSPKLPCSLVFPPKITADALASPPLSPPPPPSSLKKITVSSPQSLPLEAKMQDGGRLRRKDSRPLKKTTISVICV